MIILAIILIMIIAVCLALKVKKRSKHAINSDKRLVNSSDSIIDNGIPSKKRNDAIKYICIFLIYCGILFCIYAKYYFADQFPMSGDGLAFVSNQAFVGDSLHMYGELPLWNKWLSAGMPNNPFQIINLLNVLPPKLMIYALYIGSVALAALYFYRYLLELECSEITAFAISICYLLSIHLGGLRKSHAYLIFSTTLVPVIIFYAERYLRTERLRWLLVSSAVTALQFTMYIQYMVYTVLFVVAYLLAFGIKRKIPVRTMLLHGMLWGLVLIALLSFTLFPMLEQNAYYTKAGFARSSFEYFKSYSVHPIKLIEMLFPRFFAGEVYQAYGPMHSSEMDVELFLGYGIFALLMFCSQLARQDFRIRFNFTAMMVVFVYAALGAFPSIAALIYKIPYLGDFRCPSRTLFLFNFLAFTQAAIALDQIREEKTYRRFVRMNTRLVSGIVAVIALFPFIFLVSRGISGNGWQSSELQACDSYIRNCLWPELVGIVIISFLLIVGQHFLFKKKWKGNHVILSSILALSVVIQVYPYTSVTWPSAVSDLNATDSVSVALAEEIGDDKLWDAFQGIDGVHESIVSVNRGMTKHIASINSYVAFNNPNLYRFFSEQTETPMNFSGLMSGSYNASKNLHLQNDMLSMLGVRYLIDSSGLIKQNSRYISNYAFQAETVASGTLEIPDTDNALSVTQDRIALEPDTWYRVSFTCDVPSEETLVFDFYGGSEYDQPTQESTFTMRSGENKYETILYSGDCEAFPDIYWRFLSFSDSGYVISDFQIEKLTGLGTGEYRLWRPELTQDIYVNDNAREILYVPDAIEPISDVEELYSHPIGWQLDRINYTGEMQPRAFTPDVVQINDVHFTANQISAVVNSAEDTFLNFSQCYYPGWRGYVDGIRTEVKEVNGLIMGMEVPAGTHQISFRFVPVSLYVGCAITCLTVIALLVALFAVNKKNTRLYVKTCKDLKYALDQEPTSP